MPTRRNYGTIVQDGRKRIENNSPVNNFNSQGIAKAFVDILGVEGEKIYDNIEYIYKAVDPTKAVGVDLEKHGYLKGKSRESSLTPVDYSNTNFYFYIDTRLNLSVTNMIKKNYTFEERAVLLQNEFIEVDSNGEPITLIIPAGTIVKSFDGIITYTTIEDARIGSNGESYVGIISTSVGPSSNIQTNILVAHSIQQIPELRKISQFIKCSNRFPIQNGRYSQTDEEYRYSIATASAALRTNELVIRTTALGVPGVRDVLFEKNKFGNGTISLIVDGVSPIISQGLIDAIKEKIQQELSYGDLIFIDRPEYLGIELDFGLVIEPGNENESFITQQVKTLVIQYINDLPIGGEIIWNQIISLALSVEGVVDIIPRIFKLGEYDIFYKINRKQIILRFINQRAKYNQKFYCDFGLCTICSI